MSTSNMLQQILYHEELKNSFTKIRWFLKKLIQKGCHRDIPGITGWTRVTEKNDITRALRQECTHHFTQNSEIPFFRDCVDQ